jgi:hypothetical protein
MPFRKRDFFAFGTLAQFSYRNKSGYAIHWTEVPFTYEKRRLTAQGILYKNGL